MKILASVAGAIVVCAVAMILYTIANEPTSEQTGIARGKGLLGAGEVVETKVGNTRYGRFFWMRYRCDPEAVRKRLDAGGFSMKKYPLKTALKEHFKYQEVTWPTNVDDFDGDEWLKGWEASVTQVIAIPASDMQEAIYLEIIRLN